MYPSTRASAARTVPPTGTRGTRRISPVTQHAPRTRSLVTPSGHGHGHGHGMTMTENDGPPKFLDELRQYAMALHTKEQAPGSGKAEAPKEQKPFKPTKAGVLRFYEESKIVYDAFEEIVQNDARYECLRNTGLERGPALAEDIDYMVSTWNLTKTPATSDSAGSVYAAKIRDLAANNPPAFICHYYNFYFAHTAGGRMIGKQVSEAALDGWMGAFYKWDGPVSSLLNAVRDRLNDMGDSWSEEEKKASMEETPATFAMAGSLMRLMMAE